MGIPVLATIVAPGKVWSLSSWARMLGLQRDPIELNVGNGQSFQTIGEALASAQPGDTITVHAGQYPETLHVDKRVTFRAAQDAAAMLLGRIEVVADGVVLERLQIQQWTGPHDGVAAREVTALTVAYCRIQGDSSLTGSGSGISIVNSSDVSIVGNTIRSCRLGLNIISGHSTDGTYETGIRVHENVIHDNAGGGIALHGEYLTIERNEVANNIDSSWEGSRAGGIVAQSVAAAGYTSVRRCRILRNIVRNHGLNIYLKGSAPGEGADCLAIDIANNLVYNDAAVVNAVDLDAIDARHVVIENAGDVNIFNNTMGRSGGVCVEVRACKDGSVAIKNNILCNDLRAGIDIADPGDLQAGGLDYNIYHNREVPVALASIAFEGLDTLRAAAGHEANGAEGDPLLLGWPDVSPRIGSPALDKGVDLGLSYAVDLIGVVRDKGMPWDVGAREIKAPAAPRGFRLVR